VKAYYYNQNKDQQSNFENETELDVNKSNTNKSVNKDKNIGEYVDFEEIK
jgi:hypothetical protein